jgi:hypothetical protein
MCQPIPRRFRPGRCILNIARFACTPRIVWRRHPTFKVVTQAGCTHESTVVAGRKPKDVPQLQWINAVLGNLKTSLSGSYHHFGFGKYAPPYVAAFARRFNRRFDLRALAQRLLVAAAQCGPHSQSSIRDQAEVRC